MRHPHGLAIVGMLVFLAACSSGDSSAPSAGFVQLTGFLINPLAIDCGNAHTTPAAENAAPDTVSMQVDLINTTASDVTLLNAGSFGTVIRSSLPSDVGTSVANNASLPFTSPSVLIRAHDGDVRIAIALPAKPICNSKTPGYLGTQDIYVSARIMMSSGEYTTTPISIGLNWH